MLHHSHEHGITMMLMGAAFVTAGIVIATWLFSNRQTVPTVESTSVFVLVLPVILLMLVSMMAAWLVMKAVLGNTRY